ncbi:MAG: helix-turn-helix domain-containing protein [Pseudonocardiaceae bacterium]|nr:helix-turn-helix domain-containing protein [Pseudonocardiaceae bacterium]
MTGHRYGYARVSTRSQSPETQLEALHTAGCVRIFTDHASGTRADRPALGQLRQVLLPGDTLVVCKLDRLGRDSLHLTETVTDLARQGIGFISLAEQLDTTSPAGRLVFGVFASLAQFERDRIAERTRDGLATARAHGRVGGRPRVMTDDKLTAARRMHTEGASITTIARTLSVGRGTVYRHLTPTTG